MKKLYPLLVLLFMTVVSYSQISITSTGSAITQNFDGMGNAATATLPTGFKIGPDWATGTTATTQAAGSTGAGVIGASSGGAYNFANGVTASSTERALGFLNSGTYTSPRSIILKITNNTGGSISDLNISFDFEKYRSGSRAFDWTFFHGSSTTAATAEILGNQSYAADANNTTINNPPNSINKSFVLTGLTIPDGGDYYLRWTFTGVGGSSNGQAIGIDNFSITATGTGGADVTPPTFTTLTPADNATNVALNTSLQIVFNEAIVKGTGNIIVKKVSDNTTVQTIDVTTTAVSVAGNTATITISALTNSTEYYIEVASGTFTDAALNAFAGISGANTWNFTTLAPPAAGIIGNNYTFTNCATTFANEGWSQYSVTGPTQTWACSTTGRTDAFGVQMNAFVAANNNPLNEDWLISPAFDLTGASLPALKFYSRGDFNGNSLQLKVSTNYVIGTAPNTATWTNLNGNFPPNVPGATGAWTLSDNIDLSAYNTTNVRLAWVYINPLTTASSRWTIDDVTVFTNVILPSCVEPTGQPTNLALNATASNITGSFDILSSPTTVENYLVVRSLTTPLTQLPVDGTVYTATQVIGNGNGTVVSISNDGTFTDNNVAPSTQYYYFVFAIEDQACTGGPNYNQVNALTNTVTTPALAPCVTPSAPTALILTPGNNSVSGSFTGSGASKYIVIRSLTTPLSTNPSNTVEYTAGQTIGNGTVVSYSSSNLFNATGLTVSTQYYFYIFAANDVCTASPVYSTTSLDGNTTTTNNTTGIPPGYYDNVTTQTCSTLKTVLYNIIKPTTANPNPTYDGICTMYPSTDFKVSDFSSNNVIWDMYSDNPTGNDPYEFEYQVDVDGCGGSGANNPTIPGSAEGKLYNREHSFPRSWFGGAVEPMNSDIMHIYPTDKEVNNRRSSFPYGKVTSPTFTSLNGSKLGPNSTAGYAGVVFEPIDTYKGDFARAQFYMITAYEDKVAGWQPNQDAIFNGTSYTAFDDWYLLLMYQWHIADPVSAKEISRNNAAYLIQGNRNPYIDHPEYVNNVFQCASVLPVLITDFDAKLTDKSVVLNWKVSNETSFKKYQIERSIDGKLFNAIGDVMAQNTTNYSFTDVNLPNKSVIYYRLKLIDINGRFELSKIVTVKLNNTLSTASVYPNPSNDVINIKLYELLFTNSTLQIVDVTGRNVKQQTIAANTVNVELDVKTFAAGRYFIKISNNKQIINQSFVVFK